MEKKIGITQAREILGDLVEQVQYQGSAYIINRNGKPVAAIVPVEIYESWKRERLAFFDTIRQMQSQANLTAVEAEALASEAVSSARSKNKA
jgi:prevent-host-death family protein